MEHPLSPLPPLQQAQLALLLRRMRDLTVELQIPAARQLADEVRALAEDDPYWSHRLAICELHAQAVTASSPALLHQASDLLSWAEREGDASAQAAALLTQAVVMRRQRHFGSALQQAQRARLLFEQLQAHEDAQFMLPFLCTLMFHAERYGELIATGEQQLDEQLSRPPGLSLAGHFIVLIHIASAYACMSGHRDDAHSQAVALGERALRLVQDHSRPQMAFVAHAQLVKWQYHNGRHRQALGHWQRMQTMLAQHPDLAKPEALARHHRLAEALVLAVQGRTGQSLALLDEALGRARQQAVVTQPEQRELALSLWRVAESAGRPDAALEAARQLHTLELNRRQEHSQWFHDDLAEQQRVAQLQAQNVVLNRKGASLSEELQQRNETLAALIVQLDQEMAQRHQAEEALHQAHEQLEELIERRSAELGRAVDRYFRHEKIASLGQLMASVAGALDRPAALALSAAQALQAQAGTIQAQLAAERPSRSALQAAVAEMAGASALVEAQLSHCTELSDRFKAVAGLAGDGETSHFDLANLLRNCLRAYASRLLAQSASLSQQLPESLGCEGSPDTFKQVLNQLLENLLPISAHSVHRGAEVRVELSAAGDNALLCVTVPDAPSGSLALEQQVVRHLVDAVLHGELRCISVGNDARKSEGRQLRYEIEFPLASTGPLSAPAPLQTGPDQAMH